MTDHPFWHSMWQQGRLGFHQSDVNPHLRAHRDFLTGGGAERVLVPLCGKSLDLAWLGDQFEEVVGVEFVEDAVSQFFASLGATPQRSEAGGHPRYEAEGVALLAADIFEVGSTAVGPLDAVYDRAALIAMPPERRPAYVAHILSLCRPGTRLLLLSMHYDGDGTDGPPFSVSDDEVRALYGPRCTLEWEDAGPVGDAPEALASRHLHASVWRMTLR
ncbi:MAG: thiopurine S-methyltransferase [Deltaproteobacteria bacterium]|nr:thiopurine S-methyltransferase [Deltaproteobacteria bacterium]MCB9787065.1 thiopurine S-methyltransferase [Deltaproteobacteria bacterium]